MMDGKIVQPHRDAEKRNTRCRSAKIFKQEAFVLWKYLVHQKRKKNVVPEKSPLALVFKKTDQIKCRVSDEFDVRKGLQKIL